MKDLTLSAIAVVALALVLGLGFHAAYPRVEPSVELTGLFVFVAFGLRLVVARARSWWRSRATRPTSEPKP